MSYCQRYLPQCVATGLLIVLGQGEAIQAILWDSDASWISLKLYSHFPHSDTHSCTFSLESGDAECTQLRVSFIPFIPFTPSSLLPPLAICFPGLPALQSEPVPWSLPLGIRSFLLASAKSCWLCWWSLAERCSSEQELFFYQLRMSQSAKICLCLSASLYLVRSEGSEACSPSRAARKCGSIWVLLTPSREGNACCGTVSYVLVSWCMSELSTWTPSWILGRELSVPLGKAAVSHQKQNQFCCQNNDLILKMWRNSERASAAKTFFFWLVHW